ncbi:MAG: hypothetical protein ABH813_00535 [Patescibacteria group bacterium]
MKVFEFHFNPEDKDKLVFDSFCCVPENIYEKRMGGIFMLGELKNPLPHNYKLLEKISSAVKKEFYSKFQRTHEQALKESLKRGNEFLTQEVARENTDWLGNINFAIISLKNFDLNFTKVGLIKMFLIRGSHIIDIGSKLDSQEIEPYPLKVFNNIVSGKLRENDIILAFSEEIFPVLKNIINKIVNLPAGRQEFLHFDEKTLKDLLKAKEKELAELSGAFILINASKSPTAGKRPKIIFQREIEKFQIAQVFSLISKYSKKATALFKNIPALAPSLLKRKRKESVLKPVPPPNAPVKIKVKVEERKPKPNAFKLPSFKAPSCIAILRSIAGRTAFKFRLQAPRIPALKMPVFNFAELKDNIIFKKRSLLILLFIFILTAGFLIFQGQEKQKQKEYLAALQVIQEKVIKAESFMILKDVNPEAKKQALFLLSATWDEIVPMTKLHGAIKSKALALKGKIDDDLKNLNNLAKIDEPELVFEFDKQIFIPQKIIYDEKNLYLFSPYVQNIFKIDSTANSQIVRENQKFNEGSAVSADSFLLFSKPDKLTLIINGQIEEKFSLKLLSSDFNSTDFTTFQENIYFLDAGTGEIAKYAALASEEKNNPQKWFFSQNAQKPIGGKSIAVDGSIWILDKNNNFLRYYAGYLQQRIRPTVFPEPKSLSKIIIPFASPYIFVLEPAQKRVIIFDKQGKVVKQFESEKFDNLLDFAVSQNGKTAWLLNAQKVYKITLD